MIICYDFRLPLFLLLDYSNLGLCATGTQQALMEECATRIIGSGIGGVGHGGLKRRMKVGGKRTLNVQCSEIAQLKWPQRAVQNQFIRTDSWF
jgi:hypothetical protein